VKIKAVIEIDAKPVEEDFVPDEKKELKWLETEITEAIENVEGFSVEDINICKIIEG
jgi:hypothetical protein